MHMIVALLSIQIFACSGDEKAADDTDMTGGGDSAAGDDSGWVDADGDGFLLRVDCDDTDPAIHPGADDTVGDGVDQDCDGADGTGQSGIVDADGDGATSAVDCDEGDPAIHPGAADVPGDGVDQDCSGADAVSGSDADADNDGWASEDYGGPDCNDNNPAIHPEAAEQVGDNLDADCDGADYGVAGLTSGSLVITEIMYDPDMVSDSDGEWFELLNNTGHTVNLLGLMVADDPTFGALDTFTVETDLIAVPGARLVFSVNGDETINGGITVDYDFAGRGVNLNNSGDDIAIGVSSGGRVTTIDELTYDELNGWPLAKGVSIELSDTSANATANDLPANWCMATTTAGSNTDRGSPGAASSGC